MMKNLEYHFSFSKKKTKTFSEKDIFKQKDILQEHWLYIKINKTKKSVSIELLLTAHSQTLFSTYKNNRLVASSAVKKTLEQFQCIHINDLHKKSPVVVS